MRDAHEVAKVRAAERALMAKLPDGTLMQRAAAGLASVCAALPGRTYGSRVVVLAGSGDNGGDALHAGALLARRGAAVVAVAAGSRIHPGGASALRCAAGRIITHADPLVPRVLADADVIIDGMLGIGGKGGLRDPYAALAVQASASRGVVVAADLPSGIDADTGAVEGPAVRADVTVTFGTWKPGLLIDPGAACAGVTELIDIGLGPYLERADVAAPHQHDVAVMLPRPSRESDKYRRGVLGVVAGSERFTGAAALVVGGALRGGAGMVRFVSAPQAAAIVRQRWPEAVVTVIPQDAGAPPAGDILRSAGRVQAWVAGPGMGTGDDAARLLEAVLGTDLPVLVDADGLTILAARRGLLPRAAPTLITPHAGELARLLGTGSDDVEAHRLRCARQAAGELGVTVLLKGSTTLVAPPGGTTALVNPTGTPWLATAGSGDVLSGLAGALLAQGLGPADAGMAAAYLHGIAARHAAAGGPAIRAVPGVPSAEAPISATDIIRALPAAFLSTSG